MYDENELVRSAAEGDDSAFEQLVLLYEKRVYTMALRMTGNQDDALDISQEAFIRIYRSIAGFKGESKFSTWVYRIVSNLCIDFNRKSKRIQQIPLESTDEEEPFTIIISDDRFEPEKNLERSELVRAINRALDTLSEEHREIFILREINGLSYAEIAEVKQTNEGTVKSRLYRARENLRAALINDGNIEAIISSKKTKGGDRA